MNGHTAYILVGGEGTSALVLGDGITLRDAYTV